MAKIKIAAAIISQALLAGGVYDMRLEAPRIAREAVPGQFVSLYSKDGSRLLPRPISLCGIDREKGELRLVYRIAGAGTEEFSGLKAGDSIDVLGPLGNGFTLEPGKRVFLIGGGIGIPPMLELAKALSKENALTQEKALSQENALTRAKALSQGNASVRRHTLSPEPGLVQSVLGYRDSQLFLKEEFEAYGPVHVATEDGSAGTKGNVLDAIEQKGLKADIIYACGPAPMLRALKAYGAGHQIRCWLSLEEKMACGVGACLACVCGSKDIDSHSQVHNKRVCKDGPVFPADEIEL